MAVPDARPPYACTAVVGRVSAAEYPGIKVE